jgi:hypothetical protein
MAESTSDDQFRILQHEIRESIRRNHPNPDRIGCRGTGALRRMAEAAVPPSDPGYRHVMECSPCYEELMDLTAEVQARRTEVASRHRRQVLVLTVGMAAVVLGVGVYLAVKAPPLGRRKGSESAENAKKVVQPSPQRGGTRGLAVAMLNLDSETTVRGADSERGSTELQRLPRNRLDLTVNLPRGLEEGVYELELSKDDGAAALSVKGYARIEDGLTVLHVQPDFSGLKSGQYHLRIRRQGSAWRDSEVLLF